MICSGIILPRSIIIHDAFDLRNSSHAHGQCRLRSGCSGQPRDCQIFCFVLWLLKLLRSSFRDVHKLCIYNIHIMYIYIYIHTSGVVLVIYDMIYIYMTYIWYIYIYDIYMIYIYICYIYDIYMIYIYAIYIYMLYIYMLYIYMLYIYDIYIYIYILCMIWFHNFESCCVKCSSTCILGLVRLVDFCCWGQVRRGLGFGALPIVPPVSLSSLPYDIYI